MAPVSLSGFPPEIAGALRSLTDSAGHPIGTKLGPFDTRCTRYFRSRQRQSVIVLAYAIMCPQQREAITDNFVPVVFENNHGGSWQPVLRGALYPKVVPFSRSLAGEPIEVGSPRHLPNQKLQK
jgi:hypothetical protein